MLSWSARGGEVNRLKYCLSYVCWATVHQFFFTLYFWNLWYFRNLSVVAPAAQMDHVEIPVSHIHRLSMPCSCISELEHQVDVQSTSEKAARTPSFRQLRTICRMKARPKRKTALIQVAMTLAKLILSHRTRFTKEWSKVNPDWVLEVFAHKIKKRPEIQDNPLTTRSKKVAFVFGTAPKSFFQTGFESCCTTLQRCFEAVSLCTQDPNNSSSSFICLSPLLWLGHLEIQPGKSKQRDCSWSRRLLDDPCLEQCCDPFCGFPGGEWLGPSLLQVKLPSNTWKLLHRYMSIVVALHAHRHDVRYRFSAPSHRSTYVGLQLPSSFCNICWNLEVVSLQGFFRVDVHAFTWIPTLILCSPCFCKHIGSALPGFHFHFCAICGFPLPPVTRDVYGARKGYHKTIRSYLNESVVTAYRAQVCLLFGSKFLIPFKDFSWALLSCVSSMIMMIDHELEWREEVCAIFKKVLCCCLMFLQ